MALHPADPRRAAMWRALRELRCAAANLKEQLDGDEAVDLDVVREDVVHALNELADLPDTLSPREAIDVERASLEAAA